MKLFHTESTIEKTGDIESGNISIDTNNLDFIITILSTSLYSKPIESFVRETVSNAWDSHQEAGITEPVILELGEDLEGKFFCRIKDYGVGLSPERFDKIYKNIGSSTKRDSNTQIGGFGIGRFSALAYTDIVHITSNYDGTQTKYLMYKDGNTISIDTLLSIPTTERNGVEIFVNLKHDSDVYRFGEAIRNQLVYFENLHVITSLSTISSFDLEKDYANFKIKKYNNFSVNTLNRSDKIEILLGKVCYPLRIENLNKSYPDYVSKYPVALNLEIGDLEVTPNREEILYSPSNIIKIETILDLAVEELAILSELESHKDFTSISEYVDAIKTTSHYVTLLEDTETPCRYKVPSKDVNLTLNGVSYDKQSFLKIYTIMNSYNGISNPYSLQNGSISFVSDHISMTTIKSFMNSSNPSNRIFVCHVPDLKNISKTYLREEFSYVKFITLNKGIKVYYKNTNRQIAKVLRSEEQNPYSEYERKPWHHNYKIVRLIFENFRKNLEKLPVFNDYKVPQTWIDDYKEEQSERRKKLKVGKTYTGQDITMQEYRFSTVGYRKPATDSITVLLEGLESKYKTLSIYGDKDEDKVLLQNLLSCPKFNRDFKVFGVAPTKIKFLKDIPNFIHIKDMKNTDFRLIREIGTAMYIVDNIPKLRELATLGNLNLISEKLSKTLYELYTFAKEYLTDNLKAPDRVKSLYEEIYDLCKESNSFDVNRKALLDSNIDMIRNSEFLLLLQTGNFSYNQKLNPDAINMIVDYILARKLFRPDVKAILKLRKETIYNIKEEVNENNQA